jgi:N-acetylglucosaminyldiphosphoundecaprenol N-acetyl-beta-D-mannosaminyltransferase
MKSNRMPEVTRIEQIRLAGVPVHCLSLREAEEEICRRIREQIKTHVVFINAAKVVKYHSDASLRRVIERADLALADGVPIVWASRLYRESLKERVNGTDLMGRMIERAAQEGFRIFLLGGRQDVVEEAAAVYRRRHPSLQIAGIRSGYFSMEEDEDVIRQINQSRSDLVLIGMSTPRKELWADTALSRLDVTVCQGVGGSFDVIAGRVARAPVWMQRSGLEWFYRLLQEPRRMGPRYLATNPLFVWLVFKDAVRRWTVGWTRKGREL